MANFKAYTKELNLLSYGSGLDNDASANPTWVLTFVRWEIQDPLRTPDENYFQTRNPPLVVESDCIELNITQNKAALTPSLTATLLLSDVNYETAIHPGDFVLANILNWETTSPDPKNPQKGAREIATTAYAGKAINGVDDGFKGIFKIQSVRKTVQTDPITGIKHVVFRIDAFGFTEFNSIIYFNPNLINPKAQNNLAFYSNDIIKFWASQISKTGQVQVQNLIKSLIQVLIGPGFNEDNQNLAGMVYTPNTIFLIPEAVGGLLGIGKKVLAAKDVYRYIFGLQQFSGAADNSKLGTAFNPSNLKSYTSNSTFYTTNIPCGGNSLLAPDYWNQVKVWSILNQYANSPLNELFTSFKVTPDNKVMPTVTFRQIPFTSEDFKTQKLGTQDHNANIHYTRFLTLPRWKLDPGIVFFYDIGRDEAARINFVQYYAKSVFTKEGWDGAAETAKHNLVFDKKDIVRNGLRPYVVQNQFDDTPDVLVYNSPIWARILGDALIGGQLKLNGTFNCIGIIDPIAPGENLEFDNVVYHIEQVSHQCQVNITTGIKSFRTTINVSHGVSVNSDATGTVYAEMEFGNAYQERVHDWANEQILPGIAEGQSTQTRDNNGNVDLTDINKTLETNNGFPQPTLHGNKTKKNE